MAKIDPKYHRGKRKNAMYTHDLGYKASDDEGMWQIIQATAESFHNAPTPDESFSKIEEAAWEHFPEYRERHRDDGSTPPAADDDPDDKWYAARILQRVVFIRAMIAKGEFREIIWDAFHLGREYEQARIMALEPALAAKRRSEANIRPGSEKKHDAKAFCLEVDRQRRAERKSGGRRSTTQIWKDVAAAWGIKEGTAKRYWEARPRKE